MDFKAAFDRVPRDLLIYKLQQKGISTRIVHFIRNVYTNTQSAVWTGSELSTYFDTCAGVKQGCILSPLLFALYLDDLHDFLEGGLELDDTNIRLLMYADDIVMLAEDINVLQKMSEKLENYCKIWGMEVNLSKSEIMIFRKGGRIGRNERWTFGGLDVNVVNEYKYLGFWLTPKMSFSKHVSRRNDAAKLAINATWNNFTQKRGISLKAKWKMFLAVCRAIQGYGAPVWGNQYFAEVDKLQRYFTKRVLKLPNNTPNYVLALETGQEEGHFYMYEQHLKYLAKTIFYYGNHRLPHIISRQIIDKEIDWFQELKNKFLCYGLDYRDMLTNGYMWRNGQNSLIAAMKYSQRQEHLDAARNSQSRLYKHVDLEKGQIYCTERYTQEQIGYIMRARADVLPLNGNPYMGRSSGLCSMCNLRETETLQHFMGRCPVLNHIRLRYFNKISLTDNDVIYMLNGGEDNCWLNTFHYLKYALIYRSSLITEFNF